MVVLPGLDFSKFSKLYFIPHFTNFRKSSTVCIFGTLNDVVSNCISNLGIILEFPKYDIVVESLKRKIGALRAPIFLLMIELEYSFGNSKINS